MGRRLLHVMLGDAKRRGVLDLALLARVSKVTKDGNTVTGVEIIHAGHTRRIASKVLVDATEWGDVIPLTGARYRVGNCLSDAIDPKRHVQSNTWTAVLKQYPQGVPAELIVREKPPGYTDKVHATFAKSLVAGEKVDLKAKPWNWATFIGYRGMPDSARPADISVITCTHLNYNNDVHSTGINSQIYSRTGGFMGLSFAIPINVATEIADQLKANGKISRGKIGVMIQEVTKELAESFGLADSNGALVVSVEKGGPADTAGIKPRDIILKFDEKDVTTSADLPRIVGNTQPNAKVVIQVWREGALKTVTVEVGETPSDEMAENRKLKQGKKPDTSNRLGLALSEFTAEQQKQLEITNGLLVEDMQPGIAP